MITRAAGKARVRLRQTARRLPAPARTAMRRKLSNLPAPLRRRVWAAFDAHAPRGARPRWGNLRSLKPFSYDFGWDRGTPVDRVFIDRFHGQHAADIQGVCLEVLDSTYVDRYGGCAVDRCDVLDIDPENPRATVITDLGEPDSVPHERYDCFLLTQTLQFIPAYEVAIVNAYHALKPGGVLLLIVPTVGPHEPKVGREHDLWRFTPAGLEHVLAQLLPEADAKVQGYGNLITCVAFLEGIAAEELRAEDLTPTDPRFPLLAAARVAKPAS